MHIPRKIRTMTIALAVAGGLACLAGTGLLNRLDRAASDMLYQQPEASDGKIVLVGIDEQVLEEKGSYYQQWGREIYAQAIERLNQSDAVRPAVIALDILFTGETAPEADARFARAAGKYGNVITAAKVECGNSLVKTGTGEYSLRRDTVVAYREPYDALKEVTVQGHINAELDKDSVLRYHILDVELPSDLAVSSGAPETDAAVSSGALETDAAVSSAAQGPGTSVPSMALAAAQMYRESRGEEDVILPPADNYGFWYLPFCGGPKHFDERSLAKVLSGEIPAEHFSGKIVLIGPYAAGLQDSYITAINHTKPMYGVEYQANAIQALLWGRYKKEAGDGLQRAMLFVLLLLAIAGFWQRRVRSATLLWAALCGGWLLLCQWLYGQGFVFHVLWVPVGISILYVGSLAANYIRAALDRGRVTRTFTRYVAPEIVGELLKEEDAPLGLGGRKATIAVLFVDVRGFTSLSEILPPEKVVEILNRYLALFTDCILDNGGTLDKFVGDQAMAFWGEPLRQEDYVMKAVRAAVAMVEGARSIEKDIERQYGRTVSFGIGIHLGEAVVGNIGSRRRMDYTAIGDTVNTAARLEANAPGGAIYISRAVANALEGRIQVTSLGDSISLKGKQESFEVLELNGILPEM